MPVLKYKDPADSTWKPLGIPATGLIPQTQVFTANGTWTKPLNCVYVEVEVIGGGGGGGAAAVTTTGQHSGGSGGGAGGYAKMTFPAAQLASNETIVVGSGGAGGVTSGAGVAGASSTFSTGANQVTGGGGSRGEGQAVSTGVVGVFGGAGGTGSGPTGVVVAKGGPGVHRWGNASSAVSGEGGSSIYGGGGEARSGNAAGSPGFYGGGGSGGNAANGGGTQTGGKGGDGLVIVTSYCATGIAQASTDTGWISLPLTSGYSEYGPTDTPKYRIRDGFGYLTGIVKPTTGSFTAGSQVNIGNMPANVAPLQQVVIALAQNTTATGRLILLPSGAVNVYPMEVATAYAYLNMSWLLG